MAITPIDSMRSAVLLHSGKQSDKPTSGILSPDEMKLKVSNEPLSLIYRTAVDKLNEFLEVDAGENAIQQAADSGMDFSPEAVAERILSFATAGFAAYQERHNDLGSDEQLGGFMSLIRDAIDQGFQEARDILEGLGVLQGDIEANADRTYELIQEGLDSFEAEQRGDSETA